LEAARCKIASNPVLVTYFHVNIFLCNMHLDIPNLCSDIRAKSDRGY